MATDLGIEILREIRDGSNAMREEFSGPLDQTNARLGNVEQGLNDLGKFMRQIALDQAKHERFHTHHVEILEQGVTNLNMRVARLESGSIL